MQELINEISMGPFGSDIKKSVYTNSGVPVLNGANLQGFTLKENTFGYVSEEKADSLKKCNAHRGDIIVTHRGTLGQIVYIPNNSLFERYVISQSQFRFNLKPELARAEFIVYYFHTREGQYKILSNASQVGVPALARATTTFRQLEVKVPPLPVQDKIVGILSALDSKIENNNKINANLEAQAEALFKSWFVDFTPFKDQPFVDSELGPIPQGWKVGKADDFYKINIGKTPPRKEKEWFSKNESDNKWISISDMGNCGLFISNSAEKLTNAAIKKFNISLVPVNTILLSFKLTIGRVAISDCDLTTNEAIARFILPDECYLEFSFLMLKLYNYSTLGSTSSIATAVNSKIIKSMKMVMPSLKVLEDFHTITNPLFEKIRFTQKENQRLAALRDTLLPKLMSGEIKL